MWQLQLLMFDDRIIVYAIKFQRKKSPELSQFAEMAFLLHFLQPEDTFFDEGANVVSYTLLACGGCRSKGVAIEPVDATFGLLAMNVALNRIEDRVRTINSAAGATTGSTFGGRGSFSAGGGGGGCVASLVFSSRRRDSTS